MKTIPKRMLVLMAFCLKVMSAQNCGNETAATEEVEGFDPENARAQLRKALTCSIEGNWMFHTTLKT